MAQQNIFFPRLRQGKLGTRIDADGREVEVEVRDDEEQKVKFQEIVDLLVAAGYFRARIKGLAAFDKVVGGIAWCIETCNFDVDVDLLFQENFTIGQKIALTEKLVAVLPEMKCPHHIEPHQIQGLDFIHIFPVIQWLVKRLMETREERGDFIRSFAINQFDKYYCLPEEIFAQKQQEVVLKNIITVQDVYRPQRRFRRTGALPDDEESQVQSTLLEYGHLRTISGQRSSEVDENDVDTSGDALEVQETQKLEEKKIQALMKSMASAEEQEGRVAAGVVGNIVSLQAQEISEAAERYAELQAEMDLAGAENSSSSRLLVAMRRQKEVLEVKMQELSNEKNVLENAVKEVSVHLEHINSSKEKILSSLSEKERLETEENQVVLKKLQALVIMNDNLKQQELQFREQCKQELSRLQKMVKDAEESATPDEDNEQLAKQFIDERERVQKLKLLLAKRNRSMAALQRQLDEVPGRAELAQYQRRFLELYNQVAAKHKETKQFYTLYNTFHDTKLYIRKELSLLNNILDTYSAAMSTNSGKEQFLKQLDAIVEFMKQNKAKVERRRVEEQQRRDSLNQTLLGLVDQQRRYVSAVRELTIECRRNESLLAQLRGP